MFSGKGTNSILDCYHIAYSCWWCGQIGKGFLECLCKDKDTTWQVIYFHLVPMHHSLGGTRFWKEELMPPPGPTPSWVKVQAVGSPAVQLPTVAHAPWGLMCTVPRHRRLLLKHLVFTLDNLPPSKIPLPVFCIHHLKVPQPPSQWWWWWWWWWQLQLTSIKCLLCPGFGVRDKTCLIFMAILRKGCKWGSPAYRRSSWGSRRLNSLLKLHSRQIVYLDFLPLFGLTH